MANSSRKDLELVVMMIRGKAGAEGAGLSSCAISYSLLYSPANKHKLGGQNDFPYSPRSDSKEFDWFEARPRTTFGMRHSGENRTGEPSRMEKWSVLRRDRRRYARFRSISQGSIGQLQTTHRPDQRNRGTDLPLRALGRACILHGRPSMFLLQ